MLEFFFGKKQTNENKEDILAYKAKSSALMNEIEKTNKELTDNTEKMQQLTKKMITNDQENERKSAMLSTISNNLESKYGELQDIQTSKNNLRITEYSEKIDKLNDEIKEAIQIIKQTLDTFLQEISNLSPNFQKFTQSVLEWANNYPNDTINYDLVNTLSDEFKNTEENLKFINKLKSTIGIKADDINKSNEKIQNIKTDIEEIKSYRENLTGAIGFIIRFLIKLYYIFVQDPLTSKQMQSEQLDIEIKNITKTIEEYNKELENLTDEEKKLVPLAQQIKVLDNYLRSQRLKKELLDIENSPECKKLMAQEQILTAEISKLECERKSLVDELDNNEQQQLNFSKELVAINDNIIKLQKQQQELSKELNETIQIIEELELKNTKGPNNRLDENSTNSRLSFFQNDHYQQTLNLYAELIHRLNPDYLSKQPILTSTAYLHQEILNKISLQYTRFVTSVKKFVTQEKEMKIFKEVKDTLESIQEKINCYNIYLSIPEPNFKNAANPAKAAKEQLTTLDEKIKQNAYYEQSASQCGIIPGHLKEIINIQQKVVISQIIEKNLENFDKSVQKSLRNYQSIILLPSFDTNNQTAANQIFSSINQESLNPELRAALTAGQDIIMPSQGADNRDSNNQFTY